MRAIPLMTLLAASSLTWASPAHAQPYRCRNELINVGDQKESVQKKCGEPVAREKVCEG